MSNIGKIKIYIPPLLTITKLNFDLDFYTLKFVGPLGSMSINLPNNINIDFDLPNNTISLYSEDNVMWGTIRNLIQQALTGVTTGFTKKLEVIGIGYKVTYANNVITLNIGKSHPVVIPVIDKVKLNIINSTTITASSISNSILSSFLHSICQIKPASKDHYKGKGIKITSNF